jgi:hypothetical protein
MLPCEFVVIGTPVSRQGKSRSRRRWAEQVGSAAIVAFGAADAPLSVHVRVSVTYYHEGEPLDVDNMLKPILDAMKGIVYVDDSLVTDVVGAKRPLDGAFKLRGITPALARGFVAGQEFVHIRIELAPDYQELP